MASDGSRAPRRAVTAFFDERAAAQQAVDDLVVAGVARDRITLVEGDAAPVATDPVPTREKGLWDTVKDLFMADEDRHAYGEGLRRGGFLLSVAVEGDASRVVEILDREGAVDMDARQGDWALEGWDPARASADLHGASSAEVRATVDPVGAVGPAFGRDERPPAGPPPAAAALSPGEVQAAVEPVGAVGPAFGSREASASRPPEPTVRRDPESGASRLRSYIESHDHPDAMR